MYQLCDNEELDSFIWDDGRGINVEQVKEAEILKALSVAKDYDTKAVKRFKQQTLWQALHYMAVLDSCLAKKYMMHDVCFLWNYTFT